MNTWHKSLLLTAGILIAVAFLMGLREGPSTPSASSVVKIISDKGHGSGVHIGDGYILSVAHVVKQALALKMQSEDGVSQDAEVLWINEAYDVALLRVSIFGGVAASPLSCRTPLAGEAIVASGNPMSMEFLTFHGFVSGVARVIGPWKVGVPVDLTIIGGMSGGPIFDEAGSVVGLSVGHMAVPMGFGASWTRVGVIVPGNTICDLMGRA